MNIRTILAVGETGNYKFNVLCENVKDLNGLKEFWADTLVGHDDVSTAVLPEWERVEIRCTEYTGGEEALELLCKLQRGLEVLKGLQETACRQKEIFQARFSTLDFR